MVADAAHEDEMTDLQAITAMFARAKVGMVIEATRATDASANGELLPQGMTITTASADEDTPRHFGYRGFYAELYFDDAGALIAIGAWE
jgi:hypothetical protein